ncbi:uncharacterized protein sov isoform X2 [Eurosta solidaginis]|uniref:uncharacterized protein sov isoform X2 n=1 Tax=Eurosta solidaginis TaxID=178769 RepID=UPI003531120A
MADFDAKFKEMQKYLPFLKNVIEKLRISSEQGDDNPRRAQLKKMEVLHDLLKSNGKKLKMETLLKCEGLLMKLHSKMIPFLQSESETSRSTNQTSSSIMSNVEVPSNSSKVSSVEIVDITGPESPPPQHLEEEPPVEIPTERRGSPAVAEKTSRSTDSRDRHKHSSKHHKHHHHHHHHGHGHGHSHHQPERHQQSNHQKRTSSEGAQERSGSIFSRLGPGAEKSNEVAASNHDKTRSDSHRNRDPRASSTPSHDIYSPEECWDEVKNHNKSTAISTILTTSPIDDYDSPTQKQAYHDTIFNFKKQLPISKEMFSRVRNPEPKAAPSSLPNAGRSAPISIPIKVPTIPEVLKSPPLSASDISELLNESDDKTTFKSSIPSISEIGTRRPGKSTNTTPNFMNTDKTDDTAESKLDKVRKKFAIVTQSSPQARSSPDLLKCPVPVAVTASVNEKGSPIERVALRYNPHPRTERNVQCSNSSSDTYGLQTTDPRLTPNRLNNNTSNKAVVAASPTYNSALPQDPRLRIAAESSAKPSLYQQPQATSHSPVVLNFSANDMAPASRIDVITTKPQQPLMRASHIPSIVDGEVIPPRHQASPISYPGDVLDPRQHSSSIVQLNQSPVGINSQDNFPDNSVQAAFDIDGRESPQMEQVLRAERNKSNKSGDSSEENWDSDPDTPVVKPKTVPHLQKSVPRVLPQAAARVVPNIDHPNGPHIDPRAGTHVDPRVVQQGVPQIVDGEVIPPRHQVCPISYPGAVLDPRQHSSSIMQSPVGIYSQENFPDNSAQATFDTDGRESPQMEQTLRAERNKSNKSGYSSEENWDSDPDTPVVMPKTVPHLQKTVPQAPPRVLPQAAARVVPNVDHPIGPHIDPRAGTYVDPRVGPHVDPRVVQQGVPQIVDGEGIPPRHQVSPISYPGAVLDPRQHSSSIMQSPVGIYSHENFPDNSVQATFGTDGKESPQMKQALRAERNKSNKSGYSSEENWESDRKTPVVMPKTVPHLQKTVPQAPPRVLPHASARVATNVDHRTGPHIDPRARPHVDPRVGPHVDPRVVQHGVPQIVPQVNHQVSPRSMTQTAPHGIPHSLPHAIAQSLPYIQPQDLHVEGVFRSVKPLLAAPGYSRPNVVNSVPSHMLNPHMHQHSTGLLPNPNLSKFSPLLNDNTERSKYLESKKQKQYQPRTYMEYKQAKARAAAEEAARKAAENAAKLAAEVSKDVGEVSEVDSSVLAKLAEQPPAASTLDKLYRSTNFNSCDFPKAKTSFKIPKKIVEKGADKNEAETKATEKMEDTTENKCVTVVPEQEPTKEEIKSVVKNSAEGTQVSAPAEKKNTDAKDQIKKKDKNEIKETKKKQIKDNAKKDDTETSKWGGEKVKRKSVNKTQDISNESRTTANTQPAKGDEAKSETTYEITGAVPPKAGPIYGANAQPAKEDTAKYETTHETKSAMSTKPEPICGVNAQQATKIRVANTDPRLAAAKRAEENKYIAKMEEKVEGSAVPAEAAKERQADAQSDLQSSAATDESSGDKGETNAVQSETSAFEDKTSKAGSITDVIKQLESPPKPARILKRRNTMIVRGSLPEVDKEKIFTFKSLVYEDIQGVNEEERRKELDAKLPKKNKSLAEIFQKTDDNCKVSTQNIISGKRRTRTNVNFNEVKRRQEIYSAKRSSEPAKPTADIASPIAKKSTPKGKKCAKGKLKSDAEEEESVDGENDDGEATEKKPVSDQVPISSEQEEDHTKQEKKLEKTVKSEKKSVSSETAEKSAKSGSRIDAIMDEDAQKRHLLESFVQDILNPKKDKAQIFSLLSQILSEENLKFVKEIVESTAEKNAAQSEEANDEGGEEESAVLLGEDLSKSNEDNDEAKTACDSKSFVSPKKKTPPTSKGKKKKNELDRLNEDIRTMFISRGVLTATGRRMCTLVAAVEQATSSKDNVQTKTGENVDQTATDAKELKTAKTKLTQARRELPRLRKAKVILEPINVKEIQKRVRMQRMAKEAKKRAKGAQSGSDTDIDKASETPPRKMPILKPHTPIKQSEVEDDDSTDEANEKPAAKKIKLEAKVGKKIKPGPKSKKPKSALPSDDEEEKESVASEPVSEKIQKASKKSAFLKNTNKDWHSQSKWTKWCMICDTKVNYATVHYKHMHSENYISRLPQDTLDKLKVEGSKISKPYFSVVQKKMVYWSYHCPFCQQHNRTVQSSWVDHLITHTGEYAFECSKCKRPTSKLGALDTHIKAHCPGATVVRNPIVPASAVVCAHVCHLCNYIQLHRNNLDSHLVQQHGIAKTKATKLGYSIDLFDTRDVKVVNSLKAVELEAKILNAGLDAAHDVNNEGEKTDEVGVKRVVKASTTKAEESTASPKGRARTESAGAKESSDDSDDDVPISKVVQCRKDSVLSKPDVENALKSNIFVPTRETNDSPTMKNIAQSIFTIGSEPTVVCTQSAATVTVRGGDGADSISAGPQISVGVSIAERLSQKFKDIQSGKANVADNSATSSTPNASESAAKAAHTAHADEKEMDQLNSSQNKKPSTPNTTASVSATKEKEVKLATKPVTVTLLEDDDENWEDIEITESAPSKSAQSASVKQNKSRNKNALHKLNRLYSTNNKLKKSLSITIGSRKKPTNEERREFEALRRASNETATSSISEKTSLAGSTTTTTSNIEQTEALVSTTEPQASAPPMHVESNLGFRPLITNLADLLPDSPCNDPIELVPELTPIESLQDLCDVSSILNSEYISTDWQQNILPLNINNDSSQQVSMQEALDFVHEQQQQQIECEQNAITTTTTVSNAIAPISSIHRIHNIGYSKSGDDNRFKFYCLSENCTFLYSNEVIGLESHFICEHSQCNWNGYCQTCKAQVEGIADADVETKLPLSAELKHMRMKHLISTPNPTVLHTVTLPSIVMPANRSTPVTSAPNSTPAATTTPAPSVPTVEELKQPSGSNSPSPDDERPRIKIRRLTGDCLSTTTPPTVTINSKSITTFDENAQLNESSYTEATTNTSITTSFLNNLPKTITKKAQNDESRHFQNIGTQVTTLPPTALIQIVPTTTIGKPAPSPPCQLQISSVVSLKEQSAVTKASTTSPLQLPVISNVCSLNVRSVSSPVNNTGALWAQHIADERAELERSAAESMQTTRILSETRHTAQNNERKTTQRNASESPEPQVVAETLPVTQSTSGNYLITQTVSAQYEEGRLGFNISIANNPSAPRESRSDSGSSNSTSSANVSTVPQFKCMANGCKYQTRLPLAMGDHLLFHDRQNFSTQREYLRCSQCSYLAEDVDDFLHHTEEKHGMMMRNNSEMETIRDILRNTDNNSSKQGSSSKANTNVANQTVNKELSQSFSQETWETALKEIIEATGVPDLLLFRCTVEHCRTRLTEASYYSHVVYHLSTIGQTNINNHTYKCPHCKSAFNKPQKIKSHIKTHAMHKYFCYLCTVTSVNIEQMSKHFEERHWRAKKLRSTPLPYKTTDKQNLYYVLYTNSLTRLEIQQFREKLIAEWQQKKTDSRTHFKRSEIGLLPLTPIFSRDLNCAICPYKTKVRTNLMRHLQMHTDDSNGGTQHVSNVDPINPVPCLNSNEKHFDKMTNLASSSLVVGSSSSASGATTSTDGSTNAAGGVNKVPYDYVPDTKRYTCGVSNCQYLTISDDIFRSHLNALHSDILNYNCPHCNEEICKRSLSIERILNHLRFHGPKLYQCEFCGYLHYMKTVVDRHTRQHDVHPPLFVKVIEYDRIKENAAKKSDNSTTSIPVTQSAAKSQSKYKWTCNLCGHKAMTQQQMIAHTSSQHSCKHQYQCVHCTFSAAQLLQVMVHIGEKHIGKKRSVRYVYEQKEEEQEDNTVKTIDTRPLWLRDDPTRVRHIRGILMEDEEESERYSKRVCLDDNDEGAENGDSDENLNLKEFGYLCYYCNSEFANPKNLREKHWQASTCKKFNAEKPFRFRICTQLKCPHCLSFVANSLVLMAHMKAVHRATKYLAADAEATSAGLTCGHCDFRCQTLAQLEQHYARMRHKPFDLKFMSLEHIDKLKTLGSTLTYVQCLNCMELLADQLAFAVHVSLVHESTVNEIKSQKIQNTLMYACPMCQYASQQELPVLRHMIDHYGGFKRCYFCSQPQTTFNGYMQHCYSDHREAIKKFCDIYTFADISKFLQQLQVIFPNGLTVDLYNLHSTSCQYGNKHIKQLYDEIQKTSQQPPIPRLSLGRLVARKSIEAKLAESGGTSPAAQGAASASTAAALQLAGNYVKPTEPVCTPQKIMKRRSTVALGRDDTGLTRFATPSPSCDVTLSLSNGKKRKIHQTFGLLPPTGSSPLPSDKGKLNFRSVSDNEASEQESEMSSEPDPYSFYGKQPELMDLNKIFIRIAAGESMETRVNISKFKLLYNITPRVVVTPTDMTKYRKVAATKERKIIKPCPLSHKIRYS